MSSRRQRRPNVRLWEIGDFPAAVACTHSRSNTGKFCQKRFKADSLGPYERELDPAEQYYGNGSSRMLADSHQNSENRNPNCSALRSEIVKPHETAMAKTGLNFGGVNRKSRIMKRKGRSNPGVNKGVADTFTSEPDHNCCHRDAKHIHGIEKYEGLTLHPAAGIEEYEKLTGNLATSIEDCEYGTEETVYDSEWQKDECSDDGEDSLFDQGKNADLFSGGEGGHIETGLGVCDVNAVGTWLENQGFGKFVDMFEMHEVDEETLPLLTLEDLKDMGISAVGTRRKLFTAITRLKNRGPHA